MGGREWSKVAIKGYVVISTNLALWLYKVVPQFENR